MEYHRIVHILKILYLILFIIKVVTKNFTQFFAIFLLIHFVLFGRVKFYDTGIYV